MTNPTQPTVADLAAVAKAFAAASPTGAQLFAAAARFGPPGPTLCGHPSGCVAVATHQTQRPATPEEAEAHWTALEQNIRASNSGHPAAEYIHPRNDGVTIAEHRCDDTEHADPTYLEAKAREEAGDGA